MAEKELDENMSSSIQNENANPETSDEKKLPKNSTYNKSDDTDTNKTSESEVCDEVSHENPFKMPTLPVSTKTSDDRPQSDIENERAKDAISEKDKNQNKLGKISPAEQLKHSRVAVPYKEPAWGGVPQEKYAFEVLKNGAIVDTIKLENSFYVFGRLPSCDVTLEHPSLSRHHAIVQYCKTPNDEYEKGWYLYDMDSTHGTWMNKHKVPPKMYHRLRVGHIVKFGGSTRLHILQGPDSDVEDESELSVAEMKQQRDKQLREAELLRQMEIAEEKRKLEKLQAEEEARGCSWGMDDPVEEDADESEENPFSLTVESEALYINDPKKALKGFFEREGYDLPEYDVSESGFGKYKCCVEIPIDTPTGEPAVAEAVVSGKKKEAVIQCALEACRMLDRMGLLRASKHESHKRKKKNWEDEDFYDSDEDIYLDRTGAIEKKRQQRMKKAGKMEAQTETYDSLTEKHKEITTEIQDIEAKLEKAKADEAAMENDDIDALDAYMSAIKSGVMDTKTKMKLKRRLMELKQEELKLKKLVNIAKPADMPELKRPEMVPKTSESKSVKPLIGKMKGVHAFKKFEKPVVKSVPCSKLEHEEDVVEEEEEEEEDEKEVNFEKDKSTEEKVSKDVKFDKLITKATSDKNVKSQNSANGAANLLLENIQKINVKKGPTMPPQGFLEKQSNLKREGNDDTEQEKLYPEKKKVKKDKNFKQGKSKQLDSDVDYKNMDSDYAVWLPPKNQSGDGKTHLNEKFGY